jgi:phosphoribosylformimino-5-aminoimidazole carboxamide ribotide isomerase
LELIPVIDLMQGRAVRAVGGQRHRYATLESPLCPAGDALHLAAAYAASFTFDALYVADLDAITGHGDNAALVAAIAAALGPRTLWVDAGLGDADSLRRFRDRAVGRAVIGSESLADPGLLATAEATDAVLSLDFRDGAPLGPPRVGEEPALWPPDVILMELGRVGTGGGPDTTQLRRCRSRAPGTRLYVAGGVRGDADLRRLAAAGATGVLAASALHAGLLSAACPTQGT